MPGPSALYYAFPRPPRSQDCIIISVAHGRSATAVTRWDPNLNFITARNMFAFLGEGGERWKPLLSKGCLIAAPPPSRVAKLPRKILVISKAEPDKLFGFGNVPSGSFP